MKRLAFGLILIGLLAAACAPQAGSIPVTGDTAVPSPTVGSTPTSAPATGSTSTPAPSPSPEPTGTHIPVDVPPAQLAAINAAIQDLGVTADQIKIVKVEAVNWPNGCLGVVRMGVMCTQNIVPGFRIVLEVNGQQVEYHTNENGSSIIKSPAVASDAPVKAAQQALANFLVIDPNSIKVSSNTPIEWGDSCLGISLPGIACSQLVTPGFSIVLEANGRPYEFHTNADGSVVVGGILLTWHREGGIAGFCDDLVILTTGEVRASSCKADGKASTGNLNDLISAEEMTKFNSWLDRFASVSVSTGDNATADAMKVSLILNGNGHDQPTEAEQQEMVNWAQSLYTKLSSK